MSPLTQAFGRLVNPLLARAGLRLVPLEPPKPWDAEFARWIREAEATGRDPNDVGDVAWQGEALAGATRHLFPHIAPDSVVLEVGPGSGRYTRHVLPRCRAMILVDYSPFVCAWLSRYLKGRGQVTIHRLTEPRFGAVPDGVVDFAFANGVFEHIDPDETDCLLGECARVLKPGGALWFNFNNVMSPGGAAWFRQEAIAPGGRRIFRFYHPEAMQRMAEWHGFAPVRVTGSESRFAYLLATKARIAPASS